MIFIHYTIQFVLSSIGTDVVSILIYTKAPIFPDFVDSFPGFSAIYYFTIFPNLCKVDNLTL